MMPRDGWVVAVEACWLADDGSQGMRAARMELLQCIVLFVADRLQPFVAVVRLGVGMVGEVLHPAVGGGTVPMLHAFGDGDDNAGLQLYSGFAPFLVPSAPAHAYQHLGGTVVYVPVVAAAGLEGDVAEAARGVKECQVALPNEILRVGIVGVALRPNREGVGCRLAEAYRVQLLFCVCFWA